MSSLENLNTESKEEEKKVEEPPSTLEMAELTTLSEKRKTQAFKLITDSQAQRQNLENNHMLYHFYTISAYIATVSLTVYFCKKDLGLLVMYISGVTIAFLSLVGRLSENEISKAESMVIEDFYPKGGKSVGYVYKDMVVAAIFAVPGENDKEWIIKGWSTLRRYRNTGLGKDMLEWLFKQAKSAGVSKIYIQTKSVEKEAEHLLLANKFHLEKSTPLPGLQGSLFNLEEHDWVLELTKEH